MDHRIEALEEYAKAHQVPIMESDGIAFLLRYIEEHDIHHILEIGTAIGYSAIRMCLVNPDIMITTIERDEKRYQEAIQNIKNFGLENRIKILLQDALTVELEDLFDMIFIDAAKSQYIKFFEKFEKNLKKNGVIISDNLNFHGLMHVEESTLSRNIRGMVRKLKQYRTFLENHSQYQTIIYNIGDGVGVSVRNS